MTIITTKFVRKPVVVEAVQVTEDNFYEAAMWCNGDIHEEKSSSSRYIRVRVHSPQSERQKQAHIGDWILYANRGYKIYTDKAFQKSFDKEPSAELKEAWSNFKKGMGEAADEARHILEQSIVDGPSNKKHYRGTDKHTS